MLEILIPFIVISNMGATALGVGSSTLVVIIFLTALRDNTIDQSERAILGMVYITLRTAMVLILLTTFFILWQRPLLFTGQTPYLLTLIAVLYGNAFLMTKHWISMRLGPAVQAATWYTLGFITTIHMFSLFELTISNFLLLYAADLLLALALVNLYMLYIQKHPTPKDQKPRF